MMKPMMNAFHFLPLSDPQKMDKTLCQTIQQSAFFPF